MDYRTVLWWKSTWCGNRGEVTLVTFFGGERSAIFSRRRLVVGVCSALATVTVGNFYQTCSYCQVLFNQRAVWLISFPKFHARPKFIKKRVIYGQLRYVS